MLTFSVNDYEGRIKKGAVIWATILKHKRYFYYFNQTQGEEAMHRTYMTALNNLDWAYGDEIDSYIKSLARTILQTGDKEVVTDLVTEKGEIAPVFTQLRDFIDIEEMDGLDEIKDKFKYMYLQYSDFVLLENLFIYDEAIQIKGLRNIKVKDKELKHEISRLIYSYGTKRVINALAEFFNELPNLTNRRETGLIKEIKLKKPVMTVLDKLPDTPLIMDDNGKYYNICKKTLTMQKNPDFFKWDVISQTMCDILKVDLVPYMDYMYNQIFVDERLNTQHIQWCGEMYSLTTPLGERYINMDREQFLTRVRTELVLNLMLHSIGAVVAVSNESVYIKPNRAFQYETFRVKMKSVDKTIDLPITLHIRKRGF